MRTSFAILALSAIASVSAQRKVFSNTDINVGAVPLNTRGKLRQGSMTEKGERGKGKKKDRPTHRRRSRRSRRRATNEPNANAAILFFSRLVPR